MDKEEVEYVYEWTITQPLKKWNFAICNNMDILSEISQKEKEKYRMLPLDI